jgi:hypothetical protein
MAVIDRYKVENNQENLAKGVALLSRRAVIG